jgi:CO/xanthine dehydrogenase FAD-binding subunit
MGMAVLVPRSLEEALGALAAWPDAELVAGGTDLMVEVNFGRRRPGSVVALRGVGELRRWWREGDEVVLGAGLTWSDLTEAPLADLAPGLAAAARTVGSPQIRNAGTLAGNVATASPAGDGLPVLYALGAVVELAGAAGSRRVPVAELITGPKRTAVDRGEIITAVRIPVAAGPQEFLKVGTRNAMVIAVSSCALVVDRTARRVACALGSVGPTVLRCADAEDFAASAVDWESDDISGRDVEEFARLAASVATPIDDQRSTAAYRAHSVEVLARRAVLRAFPGASR